LNTPKQKQKEKEGKATLEFLKHFFITVLFHKKDKEEGRRRR